MWEGEKGSSSQQKKDNPNEERQTRLRGISDPQTGFQVPDIKKKNRLVKRFQKKIGEHGTRGKKKNPSASTVRTERTKGYQARTHQMDKSQPPGKIKPTKGKKTVNRRETVFRKSGGGKGASRQLGWFLIVGKQSGLLLP